MLQGQKNTPILAHFRETFFLQKIAQNFFGFFKMIKKSDDIHPVSSPIPWKIRTGSSLEMITVSKISTKNTTVCVSGTTEFANIESEFGNINPLIQTKTTESAITATTESGDSTICNGKNLIFFCKDV